MARTRPILLGILAALTISGIATAAASASEFIIEKSGIKESLTVALHGAFTSTTSILKGEILGEKVEIVSTAGTGTFSIGPNGTSTYSITLSGNTIKEAGKEAISGCTVPSISSSGFGQLLPKAVEGHILNTFYGPEDTEAGEFFTVKVQGSKCGLKGSYKVTGNLSCPLWDIYFPYILDILWLKTEGQDLELDERAATLEGKISLELYDEVPFEAVES